MFNFGKSRAQREQERKIAQKIAQNQLKRDLGNYIASLGKLYEDQRRRTVQLELGGQHQLALRSMKYTRTIAALSGRMSEVGAKLEMIAALDGVGGALNQFSENCRRLSASVAGLFDLSRLAAGAANIEGVIQQMDMMISQADHMLEPLESLEEPESDDPELENELRAAMSRHAEKAIDLTDRMLGGRRTVSNR